MKSLIFSISSRCAFCSTLLIAIALPSLASARGRAPEPTILQLSPPRLLLASLALRDRDDDSEDAPRRSGDDDDESDHRARRRQSEERSDEGEAQRDDGDSANGSWGVVAGSGVNGQAIHAELGAPGTRVTYLFSRDDRWSTGGGLEVDFPPLSAAGSNTYGFNAIRLIGSFTSITPATDTLSYYLRIEPQWIAFIGSDSPGGAFFHIPLAFGVGADLKAVHVGVEVAMSVDFSGSSVFFPFTGLFGNLPYLGASLEAPLGESLALTARVRVPTHLVSIGVYGGAAGGISTHSFDPTIFGLGYAIAGVAYRF